MPQEAGRKPRVVLILGIPGVGKTTLLESAYNDTRKSGNPITIVTFSDIMLRRAKSEGLVTHRDDMRKLPKHTQLRLQEEAAREIASMATSQTVLVDTHALIRVSESVFLPGVPSLVAEILAPRQVIHVEASSGDIVRRRSRDKSDRRRDLEDTEQINLHQELSRTASLVIATQTGAFLRIINNREGELGAATKKLADSIRS